jgi:His/Glu/Gln/Arg/opine family amino acid ABC transporter permease subunit
MPRSTSGSAPSCAKFGISPAADVMAYGMFSKMADLGGPLLLGAATTVTITVAALALALLGGLVLALVRLLRSRALNFALDAYVELFRNTPVLAQVFLIYFGLPYLGFRIPAFPAAILGLSLNGTAILSEVFRSGLAAIKPGQREAARAVGMTPWISLREIILPQTWRITLPSIGNYAIALLKDTAVCSAIAAPEIMFYARKLVTSTFETTLIYIIVALIYFCLSLPIARFVAGLERRQRSWA